VGAIPFHSGFDPFYCKPGIAGSDHSVDADRQRGHDCLDLAAFGAV
jgi:hypothetical protein